MTKVEFTFPIDTITDNIRQEAYIMTLLQYGEVNAETQKQNQ